MLPRVLTEYPHVCAARGLSAFVGSNTTNWRRGSGSPLRTCDHAFGEKNLQFSVAVILVDNNKLCILK